jgi:hypothetical protein
MELPIFWYNRNFISLVHGMVQSKLGCLMLVSGHISWDAELNFNTCGNANFPCLTHGVRLVDTRKVHTGLIYVHIMYHVLYTGIKPDIGRMRYLHSLLHRRLVF